MLLGVTVLEVYVVGRVLVRRCLYLGIPKLNAWECGCVCECQTWNTGVCRCKLHGCMPLLAAKLERHCWMLVQYCSGLLNAKHGIVGVCRLVQCYWAYVCCL